MRNELVQKLKNRVDLFYNRALPSLELCKLIGKFNEGANRKDRKLLERLKLILSLTCLYEKMMAIRIPALENCSKMLMKSIFLAMI